MQYGRVEKEVPFQDFLWRATNSHSSETVLLLELFQCKKPLNKHCSLNSVHMYKETNILLEPNEPNADKKSKLNGCASGINSKSLRASKSELGFNYSSKF